MRRGGVYHEPERLPGGLHRPLLSRADRGDDGADDRQLRHQSGRPRVRPPARRGRRRARAVAQAVQLAVDGQPARLARPREDSHHRRRRHAPAHASHPFQGSDARRRRRGRRADRRRARRARRITVDGRVGSRQRRDHRRRIQRGPRRRQAPRRRVRLWNEAEHRAAVHSERLPPHRRPGDDPGRARARPATRRCVPLQRPRRSGGGGLRH